jgi:hypothetical protein
MQPDQDPPDGPPEAETHVKDTAEMHAHAKQTVDAAGSDVKLDAYTQSLIGQKLKATYQAIIQEPVPDVFLKLLDELERKEREK